jgi:hypothetical protein
MPTHCLPDGAIGVKMLSGSLRIAAIADERAASSIVSSQASSL